MKRQHPTDPNLFWCPKCKTYKARGEYDSCKTTRYGIGVYCKECRRNIRNKTEYAKKRYWENPEQFREKARICVASLADSYIKSCLNTLEIAITPETIELKRQQIIMKRTLKEFKKWREEREDESGHANVQGE